MTVVKQMQVFVCPIEEVCDLSTDMQILNSNKEVSLNKNTCLSYRFVYNSQPNFSTVETGVSVLNIKRGNYRQKEEMTR